MIYDLAIIGGGPAGLMAASRASELGAKVIIIEKNRQPGIKLLLTGNGRCNITNRIEDHKILASQYGPNGKFLLSGFSKFDAENTIEYFENRGIKTKVENNNRVLPASDNARDVLTALLIDLKQHQVTIQTGVPVAKINTADQKISQLVLATGEEVVAKNYLIATGGKSYPLTGSTGDAYSWLQKMGHTINKPTAALTPIIIADKFVATLEGLSFKNVLLAVKQNTKVIAKEQGDIIFTSTGLSGPAIINLSRLIAAQPIHNTKLVLDLFPSQSEKELQTNLQTAWQEQPNKTIKNSLSILTSPKFIDLILSRVKIDPTKKVNSVTREERNSLVTALKFFMLNISRLEGFDKAVITKGGVKISEVNPKSMRSKLISNLYLAGEILDLDGPTGGFNLQICWTTGYVAGENAI